MINWLGGNCVYVWVCWVGVGWGLGVFDRGIIEGGREGVKKEL